MKILILSPDNDGNKFCVIGVSLDEMVIGLIIDANWEY